MGQIVEEFAETRSAAKKPSAMIHGDKSRCPQNALSHRKHKSTLLENTATLSAFVYIILHDGHTLPGHLCWLNRFGLYLLLGPIELFQHNFIELFCLHIFTKAVDI